MLKRLTNNWTLKLTSLVLAIALWSHVRGEVNPWETATFRVPLRVIPPRNMVLSSDSKPPTTIRVTLRGPRSSLRQLKGSAPANPLAPTDEVPVLGGDQIRARLDFSTVRKGRQKVPIVAETTVEDLEVLGTQPANAEVTLDRAESESFSVRPQFAPSAVDGLRLTDTAVNPSRVEVFGPSSVLSRVVTVRALADDRKINPGSLRISRVPLVALDERERVVEGVQVEPEFATIQATVREEQGTRTVRVMARLKGEPADGFRATVTTVSPSSLTLRGPSRVLRELNSVRVTLDVSGVDSDLRRRVAVSLPQRVTAIGSERVMVEAEIVRGAKASETATPNMSVLHDADPARMGDSSPRSAPTARSEKHTRDTTVSGGKVHVGDNKPADAAEPVRSTPGGSPVLPAPAPRP